MAGVNDNAYTSGHWLNSDGYKKLDKTQQGNIQNDFLNMNKNQSAGKYNGMGAHDIAQKYGLYTAPTVDQKFDSINKGRADELGKVQSGFYDNPNNRSFLGSDGKYAYDLFKKTGDTTFWNKAKAGQSSPYDDLINFFGMNGINLGNEGAYDAWNRQGEGFKANTMAGAGMGIMPNQNGNGGYGGGSFGGGGGGGEFEAFLKMFMEMFGGGGGVDTANKFLPAGNNDGVHLFTDNQHAQPTLDAIGKKIGGQ